MMTTSGKNSLDLLRLVAAALVLYSHQYALLGLPEPSFFGWTTFGGAGVSIFFFLSGMLVWSSWALDPDLQRFFVRRSLRISPALWVVVSCSVFLLGPVFSTLRGPDYFAAPETWRYLSTALLVGRHTLPGVFSDHPFPLAVKGSLWTLPVELRFLFSKWWFTGARVRVGTSASPLAFLSCSRVGSLLQPGTLSRNGLCVSNPEPGLHDETR